MHCDWLIILYIRYWILKWEEKLGKREVATCKLDMNIDHSLHYSFKRLVKRTVRREGEARFLKLNLSKGYSFSNSNFYAKSRVIFKFKFTQGVLIFKLNFLREIERSRNKQRYYSCLPKGCFMPAPSPAALTRVEEYGIRNYNYNLIILQIYKSD